VAWYIGQSLLMMAIAFLTGLLVGYLLWGRRYRRLEQADAVRAVDPSTVLPHRAAAAPAAARMAPAAQVAPDPAADVSTATTMPAGELEDEFESESEDEFEGEHEGEFEHEAGHVGGHDGELEGEHEAGHDGEAEHVAVSEQDGEAEPQLEAAHETGHDQEHDVEADREGGFGADHEDEFQQDVTPLNGVTEAVIAEHADAEHAEAEAEAGEPPRAAEIVAQAEGTPATAAGPQSLFDAAGQPDPVAATTAAASTSAGTPSSPTQSDRLELIEGIGPKIALALRTAGIRTFADVAGSDEATLRNALADATLRFAPSLSSWAQQARLLADGDHEGHAALTEQLVAGRTPKAQG
jgi:predicted flap endonuclease-1-like 5' DNA nuclease